MGYIKLRGAVHMHTYMYMYIKLYVHTCIYQSCIEYTTQTLAKIDIILAIMLTRLVFMWTVTYGTITHG